MGKFQACCKKTGLIEHQSDHGGWYCRHPLVFLVEAADDICYQILDLEDAFVAGDLSGKTVIEVLSSIVNPNDDRSSASEDEKIQLLRALAIGKAIGACVEAFKENYDAIMDGSFNKSLVEASSIAKQFKEIEELARAKIFTARRKTELEVSGRSIIRRVLNGVIPIYENLAMQSWDSTKLSAHNQQLVRALNINFEGIDTETAALHSLGDFVSGMTDRYAVKVSKIVSGIY